MAHAVPLTERRFGERVVAPLMVEYRVGPFTGRDLTHDVSDTGLFICTNKEAGIGSRIYLTLHLGARGVLRILGKVVRTARLGLSALPGLGIEFDALYEDDRLMLRKYLRTNLTRVRGYAPPEEQLVPVPVRAKPIPGTKEPRAELSVRRVERRWLPKDITTDLQRLGGWLFYYSLMALPFVVAYFILMAVLQILDAIPMAM